MAKLSKKVIITGRDIIKGAVTSNNFNNNLIFDAMPWQMVNLEDKTDEWKEWVADYFEWVGLRQVYSKHKRYIKNRRMAAGILDMDDYMVGGNHDINDYNYLNPLVASDTEVSDPLRKFYPIIPAFIKVLDGEFLKRDLQVHVTCTDRETENDKLKYKMQMVNDIVMKKAMADKTKALQTLGLAPQSEDFQKQLDSEKQLVASQQKYKKYRHILEKFGQSVINKEYERFNMAELEREAFIETICNAEQAWHLDMMEDGFRVEFLDNAYTFNHTSSNVKYYSKGDYFGFFENVTVGDIINKDGKRLKTEDYDRLQETISQLSNSAISGSNGFLTDAEKGMPNAYYDSSKPYPEATNVPMAQYWQNETLKNLKDPINYSAFDLQNMVNGQNKVSFDEPKMFRKMRLYFRSQRKIGWLVKKNKQGMVEFQDWIDENFVVTEEPIYDKSLILEETADNLIYGEHIQWEWTNEWRHIMKISANYSHPFWKTVGITSFEPIYIDGERIKYQFAGDSDNNMDIDPPFEGRQYKMKGVRPISEVELLAPFQITHNIAMNRVPDIMFDDIGLALAINKLTLPVDRPGIESSGDPIQDMMDNLHKTKVFDFNVDRELIREQGNAAPIIPQVLNLSRIQEGMQYLDLAGKLKEMAGETIGISRQRMAQAKASESATQTTAGINYSETQTEPLFHQHIVEFMPRVYQKIIEAAGFYCSISQAARDYYQTTDEGDAMIQLENRNGNPPRYNIKCTSSIKDKEIKQKLEQIFMQNNTTGTDMYDLALGVIENSPTEILDNLRLAKIDREQKEQQKYQQDMAAQKQAEDAATAKQKEQQDFDARENELDRESAERISVNRGLGGVQSDTNNDGKIDAYQNMQMEFKKLQENNSQTNIASKLKLDMQSHLDDLNIKEKQMLSRQAIEQKKLALALANQNSHDDKKLNKEIAKKQKVV